MINKIKALLDSERGMTLVNTLFVLSLFIRNRGISFIAYIVWIGCLVYFIKKTPSKAVKVVNGIFILFAAAMIGANLYFLIRNL